ncbi:MAG TPA: hypothetical protein VNU19_07485 [Candidatus Acidoferrum sp.]|jgi:hypothetical protein|nr:hypothetical protein [Candidatus Acidoferrum sp.]
MQLRPLTRTPAAAQKEGELPLEVRLHHLHQRRRRAFLRSLLSTAGWMAVILVAAGFALALSLGLTQR